ncbi:hypothetical protein SCB49_05837 [unidentified eubacterium SCB49]|nr:hypothetical protein SCB49_05837 [unidentified eubacterium SCB49]
MLFKGIELRLPNEAAFISVVEAALNLSLEIQRPL